MLLILKYQNAARGDAILLAANRYCMRLISPNCIDTIEFRLRDKRWVSTDGCVVEIEAAIYDGRTDMTDFASHFLHAVNAAKYRRFMNGGVKLCRLF